jgi:murein DD-endopeptidase MepM/ murein hydrolase activator NlpD
MAFPWLMALQALPAVISAGQSLFGNNAPPQMQRQPLMTWDQAMAAAKAQLQPAMQQFDANSMARGFYGQMPTDAYRNPYFAGQQTALANQMMQQEADMRLKQGQFELNSWSAQKANQQNNFSNMLNGLNMAWGGYKDYADLTGTLPFTGGQQTADMQRKIIDEYLKNNPSANPWQQP